MNLWNFLKSTSGKFVLGIPQLAGIAGVGMLAVYGSYEVDNTYASKQAPIRTLSGISRSSSYEGLQQKDGNLTSINIKDSLNQVASPEERAALEARNVYTGSSVDATEASIANWSAGSAAEGAVTDGLGMGANRTVMNEPAGGSATRGANTRGGVNPAAVSAGAEGAGGTARPTLGTASMARASGNVFAAASGPISSGSGSPATRGGGASSSGGEGYQFSGAMPSGSNAISAMNAGKGFRTSNSTFMAGGRQSTSGRGRRSPQDKNALRDIAKRSADAAGNRDRSSNEGSRAFLASTRNSGGMQVEGGVTTGGSGGSADFDSPNSKNLRAIGDWAEETDNFAEEQQKARNRLMWMTLALVAATVVAIPIAFNLISKGSKSGLFGLPLIAWGWVILGAVMAYAATVIGFGIHYDKNYNGNLMPIMSYVLGGASIAAMITTGLMAMKSTGQKAIQEKFMKGAKKAANTVGQMAFQKAASTGVQKLMNEQPSTTKK